MGVYCRFPLTSAGLALLSLTRHGVAVILHFHHNWATGFEGVCVIFQPQSNNNKGYKTLAKKIGLYLDHWQVTVDLKFLSRQVRS